MCKKLVFFLIMLFISLTDGLGQVPRLITYQGVLTDNDVSVNGSKTLTFRLFDDASAGTKLWEEVQTVSITDGLFRVLLGSIDQFPSTVTFDKPYWLSIQVDQEAEFDRVPITSVGYSFYSSKADSAENIPDNIITRDKIVDGEVTNSKIDDGAVTQSKLNASVTVPPSGAAGGDLTGSYPNPTIPANSITTAKIDDGAITQAKLDASVTVPPSGAAGGDLTGSYPNPTIRNDAVNSSKILDEPGIAYKEKEPGFSTLMNTSNPQPWDTLSIQIPGPGTVVVEASGFVTVVHAGGNRDVIVINVFQDLTDLGNKMFTHGASSFIIPSELPSSFFYRQSFACHKAFSVSSATTLMFYLVVQQSEGANIGNTAISYTVLQATYYPTSYNNSPSSINSRTRISTPDRFGSTRK